MHELTFLLTDALELLSRVGFQRAQISHLIGTKCTIDRSEMKLEQIKWTLHEYRNWIWKVPDLKNNLKWTTTTEPFKFLRQSCHDFLHLPHLKRILQYFHNAAKFLNRRSLKRVIINAKLPSVKTICDVDCEFGRAQGLPAAEFWPKQQKQPCVTYLFGLTHSKTWCSLEPAALQNVNFSC